MSHISFKTKINGLNMQVTIKIIYIFLPGNCARLYNIGNPINLHVHALLIVHLNHIFNMYNDSFKYTERNTSLMEILIGIVYLLNMFTYYYYVI